MSAGHALAAIAGVDTGDTAWMLVATALVLMMTPALGLFYAGLVRANYRGASLAFPLLILPMTVTGVGIGLAVSVVGIIAKDISPLVGQFFTLVMFLTPVIFVAE